MVIYGITSNHESILWQRGSFGKGKLIRKKLKQGHKEFAVL